MSPQARRLTLFLVLALFSAVQIYNTFFMDGGIVGKYGLVEGFSAFFTLSLADPLLAAGLVDFMTVIGILVVWLIAELPRAQRWRAKTFVWLLSYIVFPGPGMLLYFLWLQPRHRFVAGDAPAQRF